MKIAEREKIVAIGLMSGTSRDGIDAAMVLSDGQVISELGPSITVPYNFKFRKRLEELITGRECEHSVEYDLTVLHADAVKKLLKICLLSSDDIDVLGFHGHTILHDPLRNISHQIGDGALLARLTQIKVVNDLRTADVAAGGQGAPITPVFHWALADNLQKPIAVLNIGGVANVTWIGENADSTMSKPIQNAEMPPIIAFDTGPGNALLDDWVASYTSEKFDLDGKFSSKGAIDVPILRSLLNDPYFSIKPPKSIDRDKFSLESLRGIGLESGAATLVEFTVQSVLRSLEHFPRKPDTWLVTGGGRCNQHLMERLRSVLQTRVVPVEDIGWNGDALEAQAFGFLAVRSLRGFPLSWPSTTGVPQAMPGGKIHHP